LVWSRSACRSRRYNRIAAPPALVPDGKVAAEPPAPAEESRPTSAATSGTAGATTATASALGKGYAGARVAKTSAMLEILMAQLLQRPSHAPAFGY
jgi:hypothetical protein